MFTKNVNVAGKAPRRRGRPRGRTAQGDAARQKLYQVAIEMIAGRGYDATTLRDVADRAGVSVGLMYRYFPSKRTVVLTLYEELSADCVVRAADMGAGKWRDRYLFALETSFDVLRPHRRTLAALAPVLVGDAADGLFSPATQPSRHRLQRIFHDAVAGASDAPHPAVAAALAQLLYLAHLGIILCWLLDKSPRQRATTGLVALLRRMLPASAMALRLKQVRSFLLAADSLLRDALLGESVPAATN